MTRDPHAIWKPSPNLWSGRFGYKPRWIILHGTAGGGADDWLINPASGVSAHYVVKVDGTIYQLVDEDDSAWANGVLTAGHAAFWDENINPNLTTISIEHEKLDPTNTVDLTPAQYAASFALIDRICIRWGIPRHEADATGGICGHNSIDPVNRSNCPSTYNRAALWAKLNPQQQPIGENDLTQVQLGQGMGKYFVVTNNPTAWHCTSKNVNFVGDNLAFWRKLEGVGGLPLTNELKIVTGHPEIAIVVCERWIQVYDPKKVLDSPPGAGTTYLLKLSEGLGRDLVAKPLTDALQKQINDLTTQENQLKSQLAQAQQQTPAGYTELQKQNASLQTQINSYKQALQLVIKTVQPLTA